MATEKQIEREFLNAVRGMVSDVKYGALRDAIARNDYAAALAAVDIEDAAFDGLRAMLVETYAQGGVDAISGQRWPVTIRWSSATPQAEEYARNVIGQHITYITRDMREAVRWTMGDGIAFGRSNNRIALDIVGRVGASGQREGGILGLNRLQAEWVANARRYLESGDYAAWERLGLRDKRFKFSDKNPPTQAQIERAIQQYANKQLMSRGLTIAKTERGAAINAGAYEGYRQAADKAGIQLGAMRKEWVHVGSHVHERWGHVALGNAMPISFTEPFNVGGHSGQFPHDPALPAGEVINCTCRLKVSVPKNWRELSNGG